MLKDCRHVWKLPSLRGREPVSILCCKCEVCILKVYIALCPNDNLSPPSMALHGSAYGAQTVPMPYAALVGCS